MSTLFDDPMAALEEAEYLANQSNTPHSVVKASDEMMEVIPERKAEGRYILETCYRANWG